MSDSTVEGGCLCGLIRYRVSGAPISSGICHCRSCRRTSGAPMLPYATFPVAQFSIVSGTATEFRSSAPVTRRFCGRCGTPLTYSHAEYADRIDVMTCTLDDPEVFPPSEHIWTREKLSWIKLADGLSTHESAKIS